MQQLTYRLDQFEGPLDLLLTLISKNKMSITDIPIAIICDQYMEYINEAQRMDLDIASEFIVMASELMLIKSRMILPHEEGTENDPRREIADAISVPSQAIVPEMGRNIVYVYRNGKAQPVEINTGIRTEARVQAIEGLHVGDTLITSGVMQLRTGSSVSISQLN